MSILTSRPRRFAAWHNFKRPLITDPPAYSLPDIYSGSDLYGEVLLKYPLAEHAVPAMQDSAFRAISRFRVILNDAGKQAWSSPGCPSQVTLESAWELKARLGGWFEELPEPLTARNVVLPCHLKIQ